MTQDASAAPILDAAAMPGDSVTVFNLKPEGMNVYATLISRGIGGSIRVRITITGDTAMITPDGVFTGEGPIKNYTFPCKLSWIPSAQLTAAREAFDKAAIHDMLALPYD